MTLAAGCSAGDKPPSPVEDSCRKDYLAAGILAYTVRDDRVYLLLGEESREEGTVWSDFVGTRKDEDCDPTVTAAREFREETRSAYPDSMTLGEIRDREPILIDPPGVYIWTLQVEEIAAERLIQGPTDQWSEKFTYCWVDLEAILNAVDGEGRCIPEHCGGASSQLFSKCENNFRMGGAARAELEEILARHQGGSGS